VNLTELRNAVGDALLDLDPDWFVLYEPVDAVQPPCFMLQWGPDPWGVESTMCTDLVALEVIVVAGRLTTEATYEILETMVDTALDALAAARLRPARYLRPAPLEIGQVTYLTARLQIHRYTDRHTGGT
jgi:hypothetical protein